MLQPQLMRIPSFFNEAQLAFKPRYEWAFGRRIRHPETTARADKILASLKREPTRFDLRKPVELPLSLLRKIHSYNLLTLYNTAAQLPDGEDLYPNVFPREMAGRGDPMNLKQAGAYCFDSGTPLNRFTWSASAWERGVRARRGDGAPQGRREAHLRAEPPAGAPRAARCVRRVLLLQQRRRRRARAASTWAGGDRRHRLPPRQRHAGSLLPGRQGPRGEHPRRSPRVLSFFCGFATETGKGKGTGFNLNVPMPGGTTGKQYVRALRKHVLPALDHFDPAFLVLSAGLDTYEKDPMGGFLLSTDDFVEVGALFGKRKLPTVVVQEGGYYTAHLGRNALALLDGLAQGFEGSRRRATSKRKPSKKKK